ncbi:MAG: carboxypeptidase-like regulatory domain-containing protein [Bacteroides cellulosilyticus]
MKQIILFIVFIFTIMMCSLHKKPLLSIIKARDNKSTEFFKTKTSISDLPMVLFSQKITGVVYTEGGKEVLIGASVIEVGSTNGTITDIDGEYSIGISKADKKFPSKLSGL